MGSAPRVLRTYRRRTGPGVRDGIGFKPIFTAPAARRRLKGCRKPRFEKNSPVRLTSVSMLHGQKTIAGNILHAFYPQLNAEQIASVSKYSIDDLLAGAVGSWARLQNGKLIPRKGKSAPAGKQSIQALWRKIALDGEALAAGDREDLRLARELTLRRLEREGLTAEDAAALRGMLRKTEIEQCRQDRSSKILHAWGKALGYPIRISKKPAAHHHLEDCQESDGGIHTREKWNPHRKLRGG